MKIVYARRAMRDIDEILDTIRQRSPRGARNVSFAIERTVGSCALHPWAGSKTDERDVFRRRLGTYRYTIFYRARVGEDKIEIARVVHSSRVKDLSKLPEDE